MWSNLIFGKVDAKAPTEIFPGPHSAVEIPVRAPHGAIIIGAIIYPAIKKNSGRFQ